MAMVNWVYIAVMALLGGHMLPFHSRFTAFPLLAPPPPSIQEHTPSDGGSDCVFFFFEHR